MRSGVPDASSVEQIHREADPLLWRIVQLRPGEDQVSDISQLRQVVIRGSDADMLDPHDAPVARDAKIPVAATVRRFDGETDGRLLGLRREMENPQAGPDPLQEMEAWDLRRANSFRVPPEPADHELIGY